MEMIDAVKRKGFKSYVKNAQKKDDWVFGNKILYDLCEKHKKHAKNDIVMAKVWLIGRSYAAALERGRNDTDEIPNEQFYQEAAKIIIKRQIDKWLSELDGFASINSENIVIILSVFKKVEALFSDIAKRGRISLTSKYLHFHFPKLFYIYDTRAKQGISKINKGYRISEEILSNDEDIKKYGRFFFKCFKIQKAVYKIYGTNLTPRQLDRLLLEL